jgi:glycosyltransferase involved in cell wall biosynthesis
MDVTVLVTLYNRANTVADTIRSVLASHYRDFVLLIVDDGSTDGSLEIAEEYVRRDSRVQLVVNPQNLGQFPNRNYAASLATTRYIKFQDSDDLLYPYALGVMLGLLQAHPEARLLVSGGWNWPGGPCPMVLTPRQSYQREFLSPQAVFNVGPGGWMLDRQAFLELGGFCDRGPCSDLRFLWRMCARYPTLLGPADLIWYRIHPGMTFVASPHNDRAVVAGDKWRLLFDPICPLSGEELDQARRNYAFRLTKFLCRQLKERNWGSFQACRQAANFTLMDLLRFVRRPRYDMFAGTPFGPQGEFLLPNWKDFSPRPESDTSRSLVTPLNVR